MKTSPQSIMILDDLDYRSLKYNQNFKASEDFEFLSIDDIPSKKKFPEGKKINQTYILHPFFKNQYFPINHDKDQIQKTKLFNFSLLAQYLGATSFRSKIKNIETKEIAITVEGKIEIPRGNGNVSIETESKNKKTQFYELKRVFPGSEPDYKKAIEFARKTGLIKDHESATFIESRNPENTNLLTCQTVTANMSSEVNKSIKAAIDINVLAKLIGIGISGGNSSFQEQTVEVEIEIRF